MQGLCFWVGCSKREDEKRTPRNYKFLSWKPIKRDGEISENSYPVALNKDTLPLGYRVSSFTFAKKEMRISFLSTFQS